ncbi:MAG: TetR/AcrR family transcriptional regulator [Jiangellaceae bacterium]
MPRVSEAHLAARRQQILEAAWRCFARQGFHATSMQDVFAESGLSAGAVYRYFPSKKELVRVTAETILGSIDVFFDQQLAAADPSPPAQLVERLTTKVVELATHDDVDRTRIALNIWSEALRDPDVGDIASTTLRRLRGRFVELAERWQATGHLGVDVNPDHVGQVLYGATVGFIIQRLLTGDVSPQSYRAGVAALAAFRPTVSVAEVAGGDPQPA